jgi:hypothetical protein
MDAVSTSETSANFYGTTWQNIRADSHVHSGVCRIDYKIICITETLLMNSTFSHTTFSYNYKVFRVDSVYDNLTRGVGVLTAISQSIFGVKHRFDMECINESVWI